MVCQMLMGTLEKNEAGGRDGVAEEGVCDLGRPLMNKIN